MTGSVLQTDHLLLRPPCQSDAAAVRAQLSKYDIAKWLARIPHPYPLDAEQAWWARVKERIELGYPPYIFALQPTEFPVWWDPASRQSSVPRAQATAKPTPLSKQGVRQIDPPSIRFRSRAHEL